MLWFKTAWRRYFRSHELLWLLGLALFARLGFVIEGNIPFMFDHGKDSLAIWEMVRTLSPQLIGPWTSIPGLFFGPGWYYLLAPAFWLTGGNPVAPVYIMSGLSLLAVWLLHRFFGREEALMAAVAPTWIMTSISAWNPFPMLLVTILVFVALKQAKPRAHVATWVPVLLALALSLGFHFSTAFAVFAVPTALLIWWRRHINLTPRQWIWSGISFGLPFVPQLLFELRHNFGQTRAVMEYLAVGESQDLNISKILSVLQNFIELLRFGTLPEFDSRLIPGMGTIILIMAVGGLAAGLFRLAQQRAWRQILTSDELVYICFPLIGVSLLHFNFWYILGLAPIGVLMASRWLRAAPRLAYIIVIVLLILNPVFSYWRYFALDRIQLMTARTHLPVKLQALNWIEQRANNQPFASYHYVPDIYDFSYQYLYIWRAAQGHPLPTEFAYQPTAVPYVTQKSQLLATLPPATNQPPQHIFFIVEQPENPAFLAQWWQQQQFGEIVETATLSATVTVYAATPP